MKYRRKRAPFGYPGCVDEKGLAVAHQVVWWLEYGWLPSSYSMDLHHINGDRSDNRVNNLFVLSHAEHAKLHCELRKQNSQK